MIKSKKHIEIVRSTIKSLSSLSQESAESILSVLSKSYTDVNIAIVNDLVSLEEVTLKNPDLVFLGLEHIYNSTTGLGEPALIWISDYLESRNIAFTGSSQSAHELERNKPLAKQRVLDFNLKTSAFQVITKKHSLAHDDVSLSYPLFVKPANRGGGFGIDCDSVVHNHDQLVAKVDLLSRQFKSDALIEEYLPGREFSVAVLRDSFSNEYMAMPIELIAPTDKNGTRILSSRIKSANGEKAYLVADSNIKNMVNSLALDVFHALGARDYGRIDIRLDEFGQANFLEANLIPSLISGYGSFPKACLLNVGLIYEQMILSIVELGLERQTIAIDEIYTTKQTPTLPGTEIAFEPA